MSIYTLNEARPAVASMLHGPLCPCGGCQSIFGGMGTAMVGGASVTTLGSRRTSTFCPAAVSDFADSIGLSKNAQQGLQANMRLQHPTYGTELYAVALEHIAREPRAEKLATIRALDEFFA